jgi:predicted small lipoprotein YifL
MRLALLSLVLLAACGADGPPEPPASQAPASGISITGDARAGVVYEG